MTLSTRPRVRRAAVLVASLASTAAVLASGAQPATGAAPKPAPTNATVTWDAPTIKVKVTSPRATCKASRNTFILYRHGAEMSAVWGRTASNGVYAFSEAGSPWADGNLLAYVGKKRKACRPGQSNVLPVETEEPARASTRARTFAKLTYDGSTIKVKVTSPKSSCAQDRRVEVFAYQSDGGYVEPFSGRTDDNGVFTQEVGPAATGVTQYLLTSFTRKTRACAVGQSNTVTVSPS